MKPLSIVDQELAAMILEAIAGYPLVVLIVLLVTLVAILGLTVVLVTTVVTALREAWARTMRSLRPHARHTEI